MIRLPIKSLSKIAIRCPQFRCKIVFFSKIIYSWLTYIEIIRSSHDVNRHQSAACPAYPCLRENCGLIWNQELRLSLVFHWGHQTESHEPDSDIRFFRPLGNRIDSLFGRIRGTLQSLHFRVELSLQVGLLLLQNIQVSEAAAISVRSFAVRIPVRMVVDALPIVPAENVLRPMKAPSRVAPKEIAV